LFSKVSGRDQRNSADESGKIATVYLPSALAILFIVRVLAQMWTRGIVTDTAGVVSETATHLWSGLFPVPSRLALLVAKPIANAAAAPPRTTRRGRSLHPRLRGALPPRLPLSVVRCGDPSAHSFIRRQLVSSGNPRMASVVLRVGTVLVLNQIQVFYLYLYIHSVCCGFLYFDVPC
jgi:hypothetical protein